MFSLLAFISVLLGLTAMLYGVALIYVPAAYVLGGLVAIRLAGRLAAEAAKEATTREAANG